MGGNPERLTVAATLPKLATMPGPGFHEVEFPSGGLLLKGYLWIPEPAGSPPAKRHPVVVWNHGSNKTVGPDQGKYLSGFYNDAGFILFIPVRRGHRPSPGHYRGNLDELFAEADDITAAIYYLKTLDQVDRTRVVVSGGSNGGILALVEAGKRIAGLRAAIAFAPGAESWEEEPDLVLRLIASAGAVRIPTFVIQAQNDYSLGPSHILGPIITNNDVLPHKAKIYPAFGKTQKAGHGAFPGAGYTVWGQDVLKFIAQAFARP